MPQQGQPQQLVLAIQPHDGKILWKTEVGLFRQGGQQYFCYGYGNESSPQPQLIYRAGAVYVDTHIGVLGRLDADTGVLDWGYGYKTDPFQSGYRRFYYYMSKEPTAASSPPLSIRRSVPDQGGPVGASLRHRAQPDEGPLGAADHEVVAAARRRRAYLVPRRGGDQRHGPRDAGTLLGDPVPNGSMEARVLVRPDGLWQLTSRGIFEIDPKSGQVRRIFRGKDLGVVGGDLLLTDQWLLAVSNRTISAYPRRSSGAPVAARHDPATPKEKASK